MTESGVNHGIAAPWGGGAEGHCGLCALDPSVHPQARTDETVGLPRVLRLLAIVWLTTLSMLAGAQALDAKAPQAVPPPANAGVEACARRLSGVSDSSDEVGRVIKTLKQHLHWRLLGDGHQILQPGWYAGYSDMVAARAAMTEDDIPVLVSLVGRGKLEGGLRSIGFGVLSLFGAQALPCIDAGMAAYPERASDLFAIQGHMER